MSVSPNVLLKRAWYALEQCGHLLQDSVKLYSAGRYANSVALALLAREELGRCKILFHLWQQAMSGKTFLVKDVRAAYDNHVAKQRSGQLSMTYRVEGPGELAELFRARLKTSPGTAEYKKIAKQVKQLDDTTRKRTPVNRHAMRMSATYVDINDNGTDWNRPAAVSKRAAENCLMDAVNDYALQLDKIDHERDDALDTALAAWPDKPALPPPTWPKHDVS